MKDCYQKVRTSIIYAAVFAFAISAVKCTTGSTGDPGDKMQEVYIDEFKLTYFQMLLKKSYNNSSAVQEIIMQDHSHFTEPVLRQSDYKLIDSLTSLDNVRLKADSANGIGRVAEGAEGKKPLRYIINLIERGVLDSLARKRYQEPDITPD